MKATDVVKVLIWEDASCTVFARIRGNTGAYVTQASLTSIACKVFDLDNANTQVSAPTVTISSAVFDTLQTSSNDVRWTIDTTGFNFRFTVPASAFPLGERNYRVEVVFTPTSGDVFAVVYTVHSQGLFSS